VGCLGGFNPAIICVPGKEKKKTSLRENDVMAEEGEELNLNGKKEKRGPTAKEPGTIEAPCALSRKMFPASSLGKN